MHFLAHGDELGVAVAVLPPDRGRKVVNREVSASRPQGRRQQALEIGRLHQAADHRAG